ncbi:hypothetical protein HYALB_00008310 [Hymenoscyphus albidus]|uniref:Peptidase A4 family protein n=1 Tax=Hymenoscyphus albidus TaxID=595503 RepID=A0A9N9LF61_9HELO|nr:hypothetical protein HYALB_00008310 [Hymenoscyphus albidus]
MLVLARTVPRAAEKDLGILQNGPHHISRNTSIHQGHPVIFAQSPAAQGLSHPVSHISNAPPDQYSINWAGLAYEAPASGQRFTFIGAYLVVPEYRLPPNAADATYLTAPWVGIDGIGPPYLFQAGFTISMTKQGGNVETEAIAWIEWLPQESIPVPEFQFKPGDTLEIRIFSDWNAATHGVKSLSSTTTPANGLTKILMHHPQISLSLGVQRNGLWKRFTLALNKEASPSLNLVPFIGQTVTRNLSPLAVAISCATISLAQPNTSLATEVQSGLMLLSRVLTTFGWQ